MESLSFKHAPIRLGSDLNNLSFLVAINGNCSTTNTLTEVKGIGYYNSYPLQYPNGYITNSISFQYLIQNNDPIKSILELHKGGQFENATPYYVDIGGLTFKECYLESFSLNINPSTVASAQVNFLSYSAASGQFGKYQLPGNTIIDPKFLHGTQTSISIGESSEYFGLNYNLKLQHQPINTIGSSYPKTIKFHGAIEELELTENLYKRILYTGDTKSITINAFAMCSPDINYSISINRAQSVSASASTQNNGVVTMLRKFTKYY
jgi:hypothetical protein